MEGTQRVGLTGVGMALPEQVLDTDDLQARLVENSDLAMPAGLIRTLTGIETRRVARDDEYASTFAIQAARLALAQAGLEPADVDLLIFASAGRDMVEPATAHIVQHELGTQGHCFDLTNACNSFVNGIDVARSTILAGRATRVLVVTGETPTRVMRWKLADLEQARAAMAGFTFGDAGAAVVVESVGRGGILDIDTLTRSEHWAVGGVPGGGSRLPRGDDHTYFRGDGRGLRDAFEKIGPEVFDRLWARTGLSWDDMARVLVHQVTMPYLDLFLEVTGAPRDKLEITLPELGNMASASLGVQLARVHPTLRPGDKLLFVGLGGGVSVMTLLWEV